MIISCPSCSVRYAIDPRQLGDAGRKVKCARCGHVWYQDRPADAPVVEETARTDGSAPHPAGAAASAAAAGTGPHRGGPTAPPRPSARGGAGVPSTVLRDRRGRRAAGWVGLVLLVGAFVVIAAIARNEVVRFWPPAYAVYEALDLPVDLEALGGHPLVGAGLAFEDVATRIDGDGDGRLVVTGVVANTAERPRPIPTLEATLVDAAGAALASWTFTVGQDSLAPGARALFETGTTDWSADATDVRVSVARSEAGSGDGGAPAQ